jgi:hypothetical protein
MRGGVLHAPLGVVIVQQREQFGVDGPSFVVADPTHFVEILQLEPSLRIGREHFLAITTLVCQGVVIAVPAIGFPLAGIFVMLDEFVDPILRKEDDPTGFRIDEVQVRGFVVGDDLATRRQAAGILDRRAVFGARTVSDFVELFPQAADSHAPTEHVGDFVNEVGFFIGNEDIQTDDSQDFSP